MSIGFSPTDIVTLANLAWGLYRQCKDAPTQFAEIRNEVLTLQTSLRELADESDNLDSSLGTRSKKTWDRIRFGASGVEDVRNKLLLHTSTLTLFLTSLGTGSLGRIEKKLDEIAADIRADLREDTIVTAVEPAAKEEVEQGWYTLKRELAEDFRMDELEAYKDEITAYISTLRARGDLAEQAAHDDSDIMMETLSFRSESSSPLVFEDPPSFPPNQRGAQGSSTHQKAKDSLRKSTSQSPNCTIPKSPLRTANPNNEASGSTFNTKPGFDEYLVFDEAGTTLHLSVDVAHDCIRLIASCEDESGNSTVRSLPAWSVVPLWIAFKCEKDDESILIGDEARRQLQTNEHNTFSSFTRLLGRSFDDEAVHEYILAHPSCQIDCRDGKPIFFIPCLQQHKSPEDLTVLVFGRLMKRVEQIYGRVPSPLPIFYPSLLCFRPRYEAFVRVFESLGLRETRFYPRELALALGPYHRGLVENDSAQLWLAFNAGLESFDVSVSTVADMIAEEDEIGIAHKLRCETQGVPFFNARALLGTGCKQPPNMPLDAHSAVLGDLVNNILWGTEPLSPVEGSGVVAYRAYQDQHVLVHSEIDDLLTKTDGQYLQPFARTIDVAAKRIAKSTIKVKINCVLTGALITRNALPKMRRKLVQDLTNFVPETLRGRLLFFSSADVMSELLALSNPFGKVLFLQSLGFDLMIATHSSKPRNTSSEQADITQGYTTLIKGNSTVAAHKKVVLQTAPGPQRGLSPGVHLSIFAVHAKYAEPTLLFEVAYFLDRSAVNNKRVFTLAVEIDTRKNINFRIATREATTKQPYARANQRMGTTAAAHFRYTSNGVFRSINGRTSPISDTVRREWGVMEAADEEK